MVKTETLQRILDGDARHMHEGELREAEHILGNHVTPLMIQLEQVRGELRRREALRPAKAVA